VAALTPTEWGGGSRGCEVPPEKRLHRRPSRRKYSSPLNPEVVLDGPDTAEASSRLP